MVESKYFSKIVAVFMILVSLFSMFVMPTSAATSGSTKATIYVTTKANYLYPGASSVTLTQTKQTMTFKSLTSSKTKTKTDYYGYYNITIYNVTKNKTSSETWSGGKTKKISLDPNCSYRITVTYNSTATVMFTNSPLGYSYKGVTSPSWKVSSTWKLSSCT